MTPRGLTSDQAAARLSERGPNALPEAPQASFLGRLARQFHDPLIYLLLFALVIDLAGWIGAGAQAVPFEALAIALVLALNAALGLYQEGKASKTLSRLRALAAPMSWVVRDGALRRISAREVVPGDLLRLKTGDRVPADGTLRETTGVRVDESLLTGESLPVDRDAGEEVASGTLVVHGVAWAEVLRTGTDSAMGQLAQMLEGVSAEPTPLERRMKTFGQRIARWVLALALLIVGLGVAVEGASQLTHIVFFAVALAVAAVPEGLPAVITLTLYLGVERLARRQAVVRRLPAVEALGAVTVILTDKTGTLTTNQLEVRALDAPDPQRALQALVLATDADDALEAGDPIDLALIHYAQAQGVDPAALRAAHPARVSVPFESARQLTRITVEDGAGLTSFVKGAPEALLERSTLDAAARAEWTREALDQAAQGHRVIALAWRDGEGDTELEWGGLVLLWDPPRPEVPASIEAARRAGIRVAMVTGDHPATALAIGESIGLHSGRAVTGAELDAAAADPEALGWLATSTIFARVLPRQKLLLVEALQERGEVVAMTGDGVNDAPALKRAEVGVAMGLRGSDVAREASDVVLLDDDFSTIVAAIEEGRSIFANIQKFIRFLFATNLSELIVVLLGTAMAVALAQREVGGGLFLPLTAAQILWINLVTDGLPAVALGMDRNEGVMSAAPRSPAKPLLDRRSLWFIVGVGAVLAVMSLSIFAGLQAAGHEPEVVRSAAFHALVLAQLLCAFWARRLEGRSPRNLLLLGAVGLALLGQAALATVPGLQPFVQLRALSAPLVAIMLGAVALALLAVEGVTRCLPREEEGDT